MVMSDMPNLRGVIRHERDLHHLALYVKPQAWVDTRWASHTHLRYSGSNHDNNGSFKSQVGEEQWTYHIDRLGLAGYIYIYAGWSQFQIFNHKKTMPLS